jgi:hypothetical protein
MVPDRRRGLHWMMPGASPLVDRSSGVASSQMAVGWSSPPRYGYLIPRLASELGVRGWLITLADADIHSLHSVGPSSNLVVAGGSLDDIVHRVAAHPNLVVGTGGSSLGHAGTGHCFTQAGGSVDDILPELMLGTYEARISVGARHLFGIPTPKTGFSRKRCIL